MQKVICGVAQGSILGTSQTTLDLKVDVVSKLKKLALKQLKIKNFRQDKANYSHII